MTELYSRIANKESAEWTEWNEISSEITIKLTSSHYSTTMQFGGAIRSGALFNRSRFSEALKRELGNAVLPVFRWDPRSDAGAKADQAEVLS